MGLSLSMLGRSISESPWDDPNVIRQTIFSSERLENHAQSLASAQVVRPHRQKGRPLLDRLADNETSLLLSYQSICGAVSAGAAITPAAEWLIDNFHQVERQIREIRTDLPPGYYRQLPKLAEGPFARYPRVFGIAWAFVAHTDSRFDVDSWCGFLRAYQKVEYLTIGELWASAITLCRVDSALAENAEPLKSTIANLKTFTEGLAKNIAALDSIVSGLVKMTGGGEAAIPKTIYDLKIPLDLHRPKSRSTSSS